jgi:hypothetical protein
MANLFKRKYHEMWPDEFVDADGHVMLPNGKHLDKMLYGRRKFKVIRAMSDKELFNAFGKAFEFTKITPREEILAILKRKSWRI